MDIKMPIILTFCSDEGVKIPNYTFYCLKALRHYNPLTEIHFLSRANHGFEKIFENLNIKWFDIAEYDKENNIPYFREHCNLKRHGTPNTKHPSPPNFFYGAMERIFYLEAHLYCRSIMKCIHLENDVLVYYPFEEAIFYKNKDKNLYYTPMGPGVSTLALSYGDRFMFNWLCDFILQCIDLGEQSFLRKYNVDMFNEMTALEAFSEDAKLAIRKLQILPEEDGFVYDPGSYGQYLGGTNNEHGKGWYGDHHYIGKEIGSGKLKIEMKNGKPYVNDRPIFNLHVHSKNLKDFIDVKP